jgi:hypothetical protein
MLSASTEIVPTKHPTNADALIQSTELGMQIDCNEQNLKYDFSIRFNLIAAQMKLNAASTA